MKTFYVACIMVGVILGGTTPALAASLGRVWKIDESGHFTEFITASSTTRASSVEVTTQDGMPKAGNVKHEQYMQYPLANQIHRIILSAKKSFEAATDVGIVKPTGKSSHRHDEPIFSQVLNGFRWLFHGLKSIIEACLNFPCRFFEGILASSISIQKAVAPLFVKTLSQVNSSHSNGEHILLEQAMGDLLSGGMQVPIFTIDEAKTDAEIVKSTPAHEFFSGKVIKKHHDEKTGMNNIVSKRADRFLRFL